MKTKSFSFAVVTVLVAMILLTLQEHGYAQAGRGGGAGGGGAAQPPPTARAAAPFNPEGYWVSLITNSWRVRMVPPPVGDYSSIPLNDAARKLADAWDPAKDEAAKLECKHYGAASIMWQPTRLHITWQDDQTLKVETDAGTQTRLFKFAPVPPAAPAGNVPAAGNAAPAVANVAARPPAAPGPRSWQGNSVAVWEARRAAPAGGGRGIPLPPPGRYLKVTTTNMLAGYLRKNGIPYSENAVLTEYYDYFQDPDGITILNITIAVDDPQFLNQRYIVIANFQKEPNGAKWDPSPCSARW
jgi:hypothetical protein